MKKNVLLIIIALVIGVSITQATTVDITTAATVAKNFYNQNADVKSQDFTLVLTENLSNGTPAYYVFNVDQDAGFVIVSAEDASIPILGYSYSGHFVNDPLYTNFTHWMQHYKKQIEAVSENSIQASPEIQNQWNAYKNNSEYRSSKRIESSVSPLLTTTWDQGNNGGFYWSLCPFNTTDHDTCVTGCVATAMAQIMKYWSYPPHGIGSHSYTDAPYGTLSANFGTTTYNWAAMPNNVTSHNLPVATIMYQAGVSVDMSYGTFPNGGSSASVSTASTSYVTYFGYDANTIQNLYRASYTNAVWNTKLQNELNHHRVIQYAGSGYPGGHSWVCDGYNTIGDYHMNWGWSGNNNGYFNLDSLIIPQFLSPSYDFNNNEEAIIGIEPPNAGINSINNPNQGLVIYPNPATTLLNIHQSTPSPNQQLIITDLLGTEVYKEMLTCIDNTISISTWSAGIYFYEVRSDNSSIRGKFVKGN
jgi:hypothetical protein